MYVFEPSFVKLLYSNSFKNVMFHFFVALLYIFKYLSCLYHLRPPSRGTTGVVSIEPWVEKGPSN